MRKISVIIALITLISIGYAADLIKSTLRVEGMKDKACVEKVTTELQKIDGVKKVKVNLETGEAIVEHENVSENLINFAITKAGYKIESSKSKNFELHHQEGKTCSEEERAKCNRPCSAKKD